MDSQSLSLLAVFFNQAVVVDTPVGPVTGVLIKAEPSAHGGVGNLLVETRSGWTFIKGWTTLKCKWSNIRALGQEASAATRKQSKKSTVCGDKPTASLPGRV